MSGTSPSARGRMRSSRLGGVPTSLPAPGTRRVGQLALGLDAPADGDPGSEASPAAPHTTRPLPDVAHVHGWLTPPEQRALVEQFREWARPPAGLRHPRVPTGHLMTVQSVCLGWHWQPYAYSRTADDTDARTGEALAARPRRARPARGRRHRRREPDSNPTPPSSTCTPPVPGWACTRTARSRRRRPWSPSASATPASSAWPASTAAPRPSPTSSSPRGDLLVFGGRNRRIYHGVPKVLDGTGPAGLDLPPGRLSITVRETGLA